MKDATNARIKGKQLLSVVSDATASAHSEKQKNHISFHKFRTF